MSPTLRRHVPLALIVAALGACAAPSMPPVTSPMSGKRVEGRTGMVAASHPDAAAAGVEHV